MKEENGFLRIEQILGEDTQLFLFHEGSLLKRALRKVGWGGHTSFRLILIFSPDSLGRNLNL